MSSNELEGGGGGGGGDSGASRTQFDLGDGGDWVEGRIVDWRALTAYLFTIATLIFSETLGRFVSGLFELPRRGIDTVGTVYAQLTEQVVSFWPSVFSESFDSAAASLPDFGVLGFVVAVAFIAVWFLVLNELLGVL